MYCGRLRVYMGRGCYYVDKYCTECPSHWASHDLLLGKGSAEHGNGDEGLDEAVGDVGDCEEGEGWER